MATTFATVLVCLYLHMHHILKHNIFGKQLPLSFSRVGTGELRAMNYMMQSFRIAQSHRLAIRNETSQTISTAKKCQ